jgi:peptidoglycan/LPS O-acetylase OafA/YrhL
MRPVRANCGNGALLMVKYRPDIDGLRAISIALVLMYHIGVGFTKGGYTGVDVFYVISGYLITGLILSDVEAGKFTFAHFYERRIRRIFPALFAALAASSIAAFMVLYPPELVSYGKSLASAVFFAANIFFYNETGGYFNGNTSLMPLHHTWSLAVEEQFYLFFPLILLPISRLKRSSLTWIIAAIAVASFAFSLYLMKVSPEAAFYLILPRAWELATGALLAAGAAPPIKLKRNREIASAVGVIAILVAGGAFNKNVPFPGWSALVPCLGAALVIHAGRERDTFVYRILSHRWAVLLGLASYSIYVWHVPIIVYYQLESGIYLTNADRFLLAAICLATGFFSWRFIERPFRYGGWLPARGRLFQAAGATMVATFAAGAILVWGDGFDTRFPANVRALAAFKEADDPMYGPARQEGHCFISRALASENGVDPRCLALDPAKKNYILMGDSFAIHYFSGFEDVLPQLHLLLATASGCKPLLHDTGAPRCRRVMDDVFYRFLPQTKVDGVIISGRWASGDVADVLPTVQYLAKYTSNVIVLGPTPIYHDKLPRLLARSILRNDPGLLNRERDAGGPALDARFAKALAGGPAQYVSVIGALCDSQGCITRDDDGIPIQHDYGHFTRAGVRLLIRKLVAGNALPSMAPLRQASKERP